MKVSTHDLNSCENCPYKGYYNGLCYHPETKTIVKCNDKHFPTKCPFLKKIRKLKKEMKQDRRCMMHA